MNNFTQYLTHEIPLGEAAAYFIKVKQAAPMNVQATAPSSDLLSVMAELVKAEFESIYAYRVYAQSLRDLAHDAIADHFEEHAADEAEHANFLLKRMAVLGGPIQVPDIPAPAPLDDPNQIIQTMIGMEETGIAGWQHLLTLVGDDPMRVTVEDYMVKEQEHRDDLVQLLPHQAVAAPAQAPAMQPAPGLPDKTASARMIQKYASMLVSEAAVHARIGLMRKLAFDGDVNQWLAREQMLQQAQEGSELEHYRQQAKETSALLQQKEQETQQLQEQMGQLQAQLEETAQSQEQVLQQAQQIQQGAAQSAAQAHQAASASTLQAMQSAQEVLRHKMMTANLQQSVQQWKDQVMGAMQSDPTAAAGEQVGMPLSGPVPPPPPDMMMPGQDMAAAPVQPAAAPQQQPAQPQSATPPDGAQAQAKMAAWVERNLREKVAVEIPPFALKQRLVGAAVGAGLGTLAGHYDSKRSLEPLKAEIDALEAQEGSFSRSMDLAKKRMQYHTLEAAHESPARMMLMQGALGAGMGFFGAPGIVDTATKQVPNVAKYLRNHIKK
jgi:ferritin